MTSLQLYRALIPGHAAVLETTILVWLELAATRHTASTWGAVYAAAMVFWAAHHIETLPGTGAGSDAAGTVGPLISQRDGDLSRTYAQPASSSGGGSDDAALASTRYGQTYLDLRNSRAATTPSLVRA